MESNLSTLPNDLPIPTDDGAAVHLFGKMLPLITFSDTNGVPVDLGGIPDYLILYLYPMTGRPGVSLPNGWDSTPGARGCTPQACSFRDLHAELLSLGATVYGLSAQITKDQIEAKERLHLPFELLSDSKLRFKARLGLPTFVAGELELYKRLTIIAKHGRIEKVFYPVFPPDSNATHVLEWLKQNA